MENFSTQGCVGNDGHVIGRGMRELKQVGRCQATSEVCWKSPRSVCFLGSAKVNQVRLLSSRRTQATSGGDLSKDTSGTRHDVMGAAGPHEPIAMVAGGGGDSVFASPQFFEEKNCFVLLTNSRP